MYTMKKLLLKSITAMLLLFAIGANAEILSERFYPQDPVETIKWTFDTETGILTLSGNGMTPSYKENAPFGYDKGFEIKKLIVEEGVTLINQCFLYGSQSLQEIIISPSTADGKFVIYKKAFTNCTELKTLQIAESKNDDIHILDEAFAGCTALTALNFQNLKGVGIQSKAFAGCTALQEIYVPQNIGMYANAFYNCPALKRIHIKDLDAWASTNFLNFYGYEDSSGFCQMTYETDPVTGNRIAKYGEPRDLILNGEKVTKVVVDYSLFGDNTSLKGAFAGTSIESVEITGECKEINDFAFFGCTKLKSVNLINGSEDELRIGTASFRGCYSMTDLKIGANCKFYSLKSNTSLDPNGQKFTFYECDQLKNIVLEDGLTRLQSCFEPEKLNLESITIPGSLQSYIPFTYKKALYNSEKDWYETPNGTIEDNNIYINGQLWQAPAGAVVVPEGTTSIKSGKLSNEAASIKIPGSVKTIEAGAFDNTAWFKNQPDGLVYNENLLVGYKGEAPLAGDVAIREGTTNCAEGMFYGNEGITSITIPNSMTSIGDNAFYCCTSLKNATIGNSVTSIGDNAFERCKLTSITIPNSVTHIGDEAFYFCDSLRSVTIGTGITDIGNSAFINCRVLSMVTMLKENPENIKAEITKVFGGQTRYIMLCVPAGCKEAYAANANWGTLNIAEIDNNKLYGVCSDEIKWTVNLETKTLTLSGDGNLYDAPWQALETYIDNIVVDDKTCILLSQDYFTLTGWYNSQPDGLLYIGKSLMGIKGESSATIIDIKEGTTTIAPDAFNRNATVKEVNAPSTLKHIGTNAFYRCGSLMSIDIDNVETIGESAFENCTSLGGELNLKNLKSLGKAAFCQCASLERVTDLGDITKIPEKAFYKALELKECNIPRTVRYIGRQAFTNAGFEKVVIPLSVDTIDTQGYYGHSALDTVIIASEKIMFGNSVFASCDSIKAVYILSDNVPEFQIASQSNIAFSTGRKAKPRGTLYVPIGCKDKYPEVFTQNFVEVVEMDMTELRNTTGISTTADDESPASVTVANGRIAISGCNADETICIYSMDGSLVRVVTGDAVISLDKGIYIVRICNKAVKVKL